MRLPRPCVLTGPSTRTPKAVPQLRRAVPWSPVTSDVSPQMARQMSPEREAEYSELLSFVEFHFKYVNKSPLAATYDLRGEAERIAKEYGRSKALEGARQAANDVLEDLNDLTPEGVAALDDALRAAGFTIFLVLCMMQMAKNLKQSSVKILLTWLCKMVLA